MIIKMDAKNQSTLGMKRHSQLNIHNLLKVNGMFIRLHLKKMVSIIQIFINLFFSNTVVLSNTSMSIIISLSIIHVYDKVFFAKIF